MPLRRTVILDSLDFAAQESESRRLSLVALMFAVLGVLAVLRYLAGGTAMNGDTLVRTLTVLSVGLAITGVTWMVARRWTKRDRLLPIGFWFANILFELLVPAMAVLVLIRSQRIDPFEALSAPIVLSFLILISLSVLRLRVWLSVAAGIAAASMHLALLCAAALQAGQIGPNGAPFYVSYAAGMLLAGAAAALVSHQVRCHVRTALGAAETQARLEAVEHDLDTARRIQQGLFPRTPPVAPGFDIAGWSKPADSTGGDYYDWLPLDNGRVALVLGDVTGHGIGPAILMAICRAYTRATLPSEPDLQAALSRLNRLLNDDMGEGRFITFVVAILDPAASEVEVLSAGHGPILFRHSAQGRVVVDESEADGLPLGISLDESYTKSIRRTLATGDSLILITDGFFEQSRRSDGTQFGSERLRTFLAGHAHLPASALIEQLHAEVVAFAGDERQLDDMTAVVVRRSNGTTQPAPASLIGSNERPAAQ